MMIVVTNLIVRQQTVRYLETTIYPKESDYTTKVKEVSNYLIIKKRLNMTH